MNATTANNLLEINAKENATVDVIADGFPIGRQSIIKVNIEDEVVKSKLNLQKSGNCLDTDNYYTYGQFSDTRSKDKLILDVAPNVYVNISSGTFYNTNGEDNPSRYLFINAPLDQDAGYICLPTDTKLLMPGVKYKFSCMCKNTNNFNIVGANFSDDEIFCLKETPSDVWRQVTAEFEVKNETVFNLLIDMPEGGLCYIDNVQMFESNKELYLPDDNINVEIEIVNPANNIKINETIKWVKNETRCYAVLYMPAVTCLDYQDKITCKLLIWQQLPDKVEVFGDITYQDWQELIYQSDLFNFNGYILPPDFDETKLNIGFVVGSI